MIHSIRKDGFLKLYHDVHGYLKPQAIAKILEEESILYLNPKFSITEDRKTNEIFVGMRRDLLNSKVFDYTYIYINHNNKLYKTTRGFIKRNGYAITNDNVVVPLRKFNISRAVLGDAAEKETQLTIFDVGIIESQTGDSKIKQIFMKRLEGDSKNVKK